MNRRELLKNSAKALLMTSTVSLFAKDKREIEEKISMKTTLKKQEKNPRVVVVGGGWSGLAFAKNIKALVPHAEVILVEKRYAFVSCPVSNAWLVDLVDLDFLTHSYLDGAKNFGYEYFQATATGLSAKENVLHTTEGDLSYDYLVFATGITYDYYNWSNGDEAFEKKLHSLYPPAFISGSEHLTLKRKIKNFKGGTFLLTVPDGNYRCLSGPYERACLIADYFQKHKIKGKVVVVDENNDITIKEKGFHSAFTELYKDQIEYISGSKIVNIDLEKRVVETEFDEISFDDASFYPNVRAPKLLEDLGLTTKTPYNRIEANLDIYTYRFKGHKNIYGCGDIRPMGFSKSGNTAYTEGAILAKMIAEDMADKKMKWESPTTFCVSIVSTQPEREITLVSDYKYGVQGETEFHSSITDEDWKHNGIGKENAQFSWATSMYDNMFYT